MRRSALSLGIAFGITSVGCGEGTPQTTTKQQEIVGGTPLTDTTRPLAALARAVGNDFEHICSGAFIADDIVLTAAHCFTNLENGSKDTDTGNLRVCDAFATDAQKRIFPLFSRCKRRGFCPSCLGRRMTDTAVHLAENVFPPQMVRQWAGTWLGRPSPSTDSVDARTARCATT